MQPHAPMNSSALADFVSNKWDQEIVQRLIEIIRSMPTIPLWMGLAAALPNTWSVTQIYFAITVIIARYLFNCAKSRNVLP
jgi:ABC-type dipeptide/oligopeptide/nickel transport system permease subunit